MSPIFVTPAFVRIMAAYNGEMNKRLYDAASRLSDAARREHAVPDVRDPRTLPPAPRSSPITLDAA